MTDTSPPEIPADVQATGEALAAYLMIAAAQQYTQKLEQIGKLNADRSDVLDLLIATGMSLNYGMRLAGRRLERALKKAGPAGADEETGKRMMARVEDFARLHLDISQN